MDDKTLKVKQAMLAMQRVRGSRCCRSGTTGIGRSGNKWFCLVKDSVYLQIEDGGWRCQKARTLSPIRCQW